MATLPESFQDLTVSERIALAQALCNSIADELRSPQSEAKRSELDRPAAEDDAHPEDVVPWEKAKPEIVDDARVEQNPRDILHDALRNLASRLVQERFDRLAAEWKKDTFLLSKVAAKVGHIAYLKIIGMGQAAIPCILRNMQEHGPNHWFLALHAITGENPAVEQKAGNMKAITEAWLIWGRKKGYLANSQAITMETSRTSDSTR